MIQAELQHEETKEKKADYYDDIYAAGYNTQGYYPLYHLILEGVKEIPSARVLEIGSGIGDLGRMIVDAGIPYCGFDFSAEGVKQSQEICPDGKFWVGDAYDRENYLPTDYNVAIALEVLEHLEDLAIIENIPAGVHLFASVPDYDDVAHLRVYTDQQRDIVQRYQSLMDIVELIPMGRTNSLGQKTTIYVFHGIRKAHADAEPIPQAINPTASDPRSQPVPDKKTGRNEPCPCGSGKKFKKCCGK